jgi:antitoxin CptB
MTEKIARLRWQCRRGMLELDAILQPFFERHFIMLTPSKQEQFERLLTCSDQDLFSWFIGSAKPQDPSLLEIINIIKAA